MMERFFLLSIFYKAIIFFFVFFIYFFLDKKPEVSDEKGVFLLDKKSVDSKLNRENYLFPGVKEVVNFVKNSEEVLVDTADTLPEFERLSLLLEEKLYRQDTVYIDTELLKIMAGEENIAFIKNDRTALEGYILQRINFSPDQDKYQWLLLLNSIGLSSSSSQQALLDVIETMTHVELLVEALALLTPLAGDHGEKVMNVLSLYVGHPNTQVSEVAMTMLDLWSDSQLSRDY